MPRRRRDAKTRVPQVAEAWFELMLGPEFGACSEEVCRLVFERRRGELDAILADEVLRRPGWRPWWWWVFVVGEEPARGPGGVARLVELGVMGEEEVDALLLAGSAAARLRDEWHAVPEVVREANVVRGHLGLALIDVAPFGEDGGDGDGGGGGG